MRALPGGLLLRGLRARRGLSIALFVASMLTSAAAALGPTYAAGASESTLRDELGSAPAETAGLRLTRIDSGSPDVTPETAESTRFLAPEALFGHAPPIVGLEWLTGSTADGGDPLTSTLVSRPGFCTHLVLTSGRCPTAVGEVVASTRTFSIPGARWHLGSVLSLDGGVQVRIVGAYRPRDADDPFWFGDPHFAQAPDAEGTVHTDDLFTEPETLDRIPLTSTVRSTVDFPLLPERIRWKDVPRLRADLVGIDDGSLVAAYLQRQGQELVGSQINAELRADTRLGAVLDTAEHERSLVEVGTLLVCLQLGLLGLLVLFQIASDVAESRGAEIAIAKLRGLGPFQVLRFGLGEAVALLLVSTPLGIGLGALAAVVVGGVVFGAGTPVVASIWTVVAGGVALAGGLLAVGLSAVRVLTRPVTAQWRRTSSASRTSRTTLVFEGLVVVAAIVGLVVLRVGGGSGVGGSAALIAPGLLVLAVALVGVRLVPVALRPLIPATRASARVGLLLAVRQVVRRPAGIRLATLLAVALGLATFGVGGQAAAVGNREARAAAEIGAPTVLQVQTGEVVDPVAAVRRADPDGRWAMAAATWLPDGGASIASEVLAVDSTRLADVASPVRGAMSGAAIARALAVDQVPAVRLQGTRLTASITGSGIDPRTAPTVRFELQDRLGRTVEPDAGSLRNGTADYTVSVPCSAGCTLTGITWSRPVVAIDEFDLRGVAVVHRISQAGGRTTTVSAGLDDPRAWRAAVPVSEARDRVSVSAAGVRDAFSGLSGEGGIASAAQPRTLGAVSTPGGLAADADQRRGEVQDDTATSVVFRVVGRTPALPRVLDQGVVMDAEQLRNALPGFTGEASWQVWLDADAPADAAARIERQGLPVQSVGTTAERAALLSRQGPTLTFLLLVVAALAGSVLAAVGTVVTISASARRRSYEIAALRVVGVPRRRLLDAALLEQLLLLGAAILLGVPGGFVAGLVALPIIPEFGTPTPVELRYVPGVGAVLVFAVAFALFVLIAATLAALDLLRRSVPARLREGEE